MPPVCNFTLDEEERIVRCVLARRGYYDHNIPKAELDEIMAKFGWIQHCNGQWYYSHQHASFDHGRHWFTSPKYINFY